MNKEEIINILIEELGLTNYIKVADYLINLESNIIILQQENQQLKDNWNKLKEGLKEKFEEFRYVEDECLRTMAQEDDSILFSMSCIEKGGIND